MSFEQISGPPHYETVIPKEQLRETNLGIVDGNVALIYPDEVVMLGSPQELDNNGYDNGISLITPLPNPYIFPISRREKEARPYLSILAGPNWDEISLDLDDGLLVGGEIVTARDFLTDENGDLPQNFTLSFTEFQEKTTK